MTAKTNRSAVARHEVQVEQHVWGTAYGGSREALATLGFDFELRFPGDPGNRVHSQRYSAGDRQILIRKHSRDRFRVHVTCSREEFLHREQAHVLSVERERILKDMKALPGCAADFEARLERFSISMMSAIVEYAKTGTAGYRASEESVSRIADAMVTLTGSLRDAEIVFDKDARAEVLQAYQARLAAVDPAFQSFASKLIGGAQT